MQDAIVQLHEAVHERRYGKYRGFVTDNADPEKRGRLRLSVPSVLGDEETDWALPCLPFGGAGGYGSFFVPEPGAQIWVEFEEGDVDRPIWVGAFWRSVADVPEDGVKSPPSTRVLQTPGGHVMQFDDETDGERFRLHHPADAELEIDADGTVILTNSEGALVRLDADASEVIVEDANGNVMTMSSAGTTIEDANGNRVEMAAAGITVEAPQVTVKASQVNLGDQGGEPVLKGDTFLSLFASHIHTVAPVVGGPTSPPIPQGERSALSTTVKTI
ncbi:MAG: phage baseplate assembly protein V [Deltaproteobacteria bacterium]